MGGTADVPVVPHTAQLCSSGHGLNVHQDVLTLSLLNIAQI